MIIGFTLYICHWALFNFCISQTKYAVYKLSWLGYVFSFNRGIAEGLGVKGHVRNSTH